MRSNSVKRPDTVGPSVLPMMVLAFLHVAKHCCFHRIVTLCHPTGEVTVYRCAMTATVKPHHRHSMFFLPLTII